jgi:TonB family protein
MTDSRDPRYARTAGLILLSTLLIVVSCEVEPPRGLTEPVATDASTVQELRREVVALESLTTRQGRELEEIEDELERVRREATARGSATTRPELQTVEAIQEEPVFTPMTIRPELTNRDEIIQALIREYPSLLRDEGVGGQVVVWFLISETGQVVATRISQTSGHGQLDAAALAVASVYNFTAAMNRDRPVPVWIQLPITFRVQN